MMHTSKTFYERHQFEAEEPTRCAYLVCLFDCIDDAAPATLGEETIIKP
jgi:hypothetical protein